MSADPQQDAVTPEQLAARFGGGGEGERDDTQRLRRWRGFCGFTGSGSRDRMVSGFDDGYDFMGFLEAHGWKALAAKGDWPYVVYLAHQHRPPYAIVEYCECDFSLWLFDDAAAAQAFYKTLRDEGE